MRNFGFVKDRITPHPLDTASTIKAPKQVFAAGFASTANRPPKTTPNLNVLRFLRRFWPGEGYPLPEAPTASIATPSYRK